MQDEFGYPVFAGMEASPRNSAAGYSKKPTIARFTESLGKSQFSSSQD